MPVEEYGLIIGGVLGGILTLYFTPLLLRWILRVVFRAKKSANRKEIIREVSVPLSILVYWLTAHITLMLWQVPVTDEGWYMNVVRSGVILLVAFVGYRLAGTSSGIVKKLLEKVHVEVHQILVPFLSRILRVVIVVLTASVVLQEWGYNISGPIAGLGLGGLAFALAAQESLKNLFGGLVIILDKPFDVGDWIKTDGVEGVVETMNIRSTRVRTFDRGLVTVPNAMLADAHITNVSAMNKRQITFRLGFTYRSDMENIQVFVAKARRMLYDNSGIDKETILVQLDELNDYSLDVFFYFFTKDTAWEKHLKQKEEVLIDLWYLAAFHDLEFAFPTQEWVYSGESSEKEEKKGI